MTMIRKIIRAQINQLGDDEVEVVMSTAALARDGHVLIPQGCRLDNYRSNPIVLWSHDPDKPIGNAENIAVGPDQISAKIRFAPLGISHKADEIRGLMKAGVIRAVSVGFEPTEMEPLDPKKPRGGQRISAWELLELSPVSVPADPGAVVTARSNGENAMPEIETPGAQATETPVQRGRHGGKASVIGVVGQRGLYQVAQLCYLFQELGYQVDMAKYESAIEGDQSKVPSMLAGILHDFGDMLIAMTQEEIAEALAGCDVEPADDDADDDEILVLEERQHVRAGATTFIRAFRRGLAHAKLRAGKALSAESIRCLREAKACHEEAMGLHRSAMRKHKEGVGAVDDMMDRAGASDTESAVESNATTAEAPAEDGSRGLSQDFRQRQADILALTRA